MLGNVYATIKLAEGLELKSTLGTNIINQRRDYFAAAGLQYISGTGNASVTNNRFNSWQFENYLTYYKQFAKIHSINAMAGLSWQHVDQFGSVAQNSVTQTLILNITTSEQAQLLSTLLQARRLMVLTLILQG